MLLSGNESIREVIAFPKTRGGYDPLTTAPTPITAQQRLEAGVDAKPKPAAGAPGSAGVAAAVEPSN
jgi:aspartyl-tRNA synthetase